MNREIITKLGMRYIKTELNLSEYEYNVLNTANIPGILKVEKEIAIYSYISLAEKLQKDTLDVENFQDFFRQLWKSYENIEGYLLDELLIELDPEWIFYDEQKREYFFLPMADKNVTIGDRLQKLFTYFADVCPISEDVLLEFVFEQFGMLAEEECEAKEFVKCIALHKFATKIEELDFVEEGMADFAVSEDAEPDTQVEQKKLVVVFLVILVLVSVAFYFAYFLSSEFKYAVLGIVAVLIALALVGFEVYIILKSHVSIRNQ